MKVDEYEWGPAEVGFPDWSGTAQLDQKITGTENVYSLTGIDSEKWQIIGLDFGAGESGPHNVHIIAVPRSEWGQSPPSDLSHVRAADIQIHNGIDPFHLLRQITHVLDMRFRIRAVKDSTITINERLDEPPQD
ncbi:hypothetical protein A5782_05685 [Mycobacterium sp. 852002-40037_SCH5390672]|nr:hypothetical protein A5782_05685 [Mycobacterium sp. 852002-40037_SCH5390672]